MSQEKESKTGSRLVSLGVLLTLALGLAAIYLYFGRDEPIGVIQKSRLRRPSTELADTSAKDQAHVIETRSTNALPDQTPPPIPKPPSPEKVTPDFPARVAAPPEAIQGTPVVAGSQVAQLNDKAVDPARDLMIVMGVFERYLGRFKAYPAGDNRQMTNALTGNNPEGEVFLPRNHPAINKDGELTDRWGTPLFFHMISHDQIEIHSAGPDRQMYTPDDLEEKSPSLKNHAPGTGVQL